MILSYSVEEKKLRDYWQLKKQDELNLKQKKVHHCFILHIVKYLTFYVCTYNNSNGNKYYIILPSQPYVIICNLNHYIVMTLFLLMLIAGTLI